MSAIVAPTRSRWVSGSRPVGDPVRHVLAVLGFTALFVGAPIYAAPIVDALPFLIRPEVQLSILTLAVLVALKVDRRILAVVTR